jgi:hypothetical protein
MSLFLLTETSAGYALLKAKDKKLLKRKDIAEDASSAEGVSEMYVQLSGVLGKDFRLRRQFVARAQIFLVAGRRC